MTNPNLAFSIFKKILSLFLVFCFLIVCFKFNFNKDIYFSIPFTYKESYTENYYDLKYLFVKIGDTNTEVINKLGQPFKVLNNDINCGKTSYFYSKIVEKRYTYRIVLFNENLKVCDKLSGVYD